MVYPLFVFGLACCLMALLAVRTLWQYEVTHDVLQLPHTGWTDWATLLSAFGPGWLLIPIAVLMGLGILTWLLRRSSRGKNYASFPRWLPGYGGFERDLRLASFTDTLLQLRRKDIDKTQAMSLAAVVSGHPLRVDKETNLLDLDSLPPLLRWAMFEAGSQPTFVELDGLELAADVYRERATRRAHFISQTLPVILCVAVGSMVVLAYALAVWGPFCQMIIELSNVQGEVL